jgi:hypothetical protein
VFMKIYRWFFPIPNFGQFRRRYDIREGDPSTRRRSLRVCVVGLGGGGFHWEAQRIVQFVKRPFELILVFSGPSGGLIYWTSKDSVKASYILRSPSLAGDGLLVKLIISLHNVWQALRIISTEQHNIVLAVGTAQAIPFGIAARIMGKPLWFIESVTRVCKPCRAGHWISRLGLGTRFYYYWTDLAGYYPDGICMEESQV